MRHPVLFLVTRRGQIVGAASEGVMLDQQQALALWRQWPWMPSAEGQVWPGEFPETFPEIKEHPVQALGRSAPEW